MKKLIILTAFSISMALANGQTAVDRVKYRCVYNAKTVKDTINTDFFSEDIMRLDIGEKINHFYSQRKYQRDSVIRRATESGQLDRGMLQSLPKGVNKYVICQNHPEKKTTFLNEIATKKSRYMYEEETALFGWEMLPMKKTILGYSCQAAACRYRGRNYVAWFTTELPFSFGPWKFGGLPGLILTISDEKGHYSFEAIGFEKITGGTSIAFDTEGYRKISRKDYMRIEKDYMRDPIAWVSQHLGVKIEGMSTPQERRKDGFREDYYAPLELE